MRGDPERDADNGEGDTGQGKRKALVDLSAALTLLALVLAPQLVEQLRDREGRAARPFLLLFVKFFETDRQGAFLHINPVANFVQVVRVFLITLLITRIIKMHQDALVWEIGFEAAPAGKGHFHWHRMFVQLEDGDVLELVAFLFADVNFSAGKLIDDLITAKERHRIARGHVEDRAPQLFLRSRRHLDIQPEANCGAGPSDRGERDADPGYAHTVGPKRDQFVIGGESAKNEEGGGEQAPGNGKDEREREDVGDEREEIRHRHIVIDEQGQEFSKNVSNHQHETEHGNGKEHTHQQLATDEFIDQLHPSVEISTD